MPCAAERAAGLPRWCAGKLLHAGRWCEIRSAWSAGADSSRSDDEPSRSDYVVKLARTSNADAESWSHAALARERCVGQTVAHPHVAAVLDADLQQNPAWLVLPNYGRYTLRSWQRLPLPLAQQLWLVRQLTQALAALHAAGWLHGDVAPENLVVDTQLHATLIDFGFARKLHTAECDVASTAWQGRIAYAAPESFDSAGRLSAAADLYSVGVLLFEWLTGRLPFADHETAVLIARKRLTPAPDVRTMNAAVPLELAQLVAALLRRDPLRRPCVERVVEQCLALEVERLAVSCGQARAG
jgi:serine/threonine-protein kinase